MLTLVTFVDSKAHMEQVLAESNIEVPATSKEWEPQRSYAKRLENVMNKGKGVSFRYSLS